MQSTASRVVFLSMAALGEATPPIDERCVCHMQVSRGLLLDMDSDRYRGLFGGEQKNCEGSCFGMSTTLFTLWSCDEKVVIQYCKVGICAYWRGRR